MESPSSRQKTLVTRQLLKEKATCPMCGVELSLHALRYKHTCRPRVDIEARRQELQREAVRAFLSRMCAS